jgi:hypothetical protein
MASVHCTVCCTPYFFGPVYMYCTAVLLYSVQYTRGSDSGPHSKGVRVSWVVALFFVTFCVCDAVRFQNCECFQVGPQR